MTDLPALTGTEKQIAWAARLREKALAQSYCKDWLALIRGAAVHYPPATTAQWWIDYGQHYHADLLDYITGNAGSPEATAAIRWVAAVEAIPQLAPLVAAWRAASAED